MSAELGFGEGQALQVGYDSEAAFSRAFKNAAGVPPAAWRRRYAKPSE
jgi:AraC-like DNA-binding protein